MRLGSLEPAMESTSIPQPTLPSAPEKRRPPVLRPVFCEPVTDTKLFQSASLVQDAMFLAKFFSALKGAARLRLARRDVQAKARDMCSCFDEYSAHSVPQAESFPAPLLSPGPQSPRSHRPSTPSAQNQAGGHRAPRDLRSEVQDWAQLNVRFRRNDSCSHD